MNLRSVFTLVLTIMALAVLCVGQVQSQNGVTVLTVQNQQQVKLDFVNAKPMPLPAISLPADPKQALINALMSNPAPGMAGFSAGAAGNGALDVVDLGAPLAVNEGGIAPDDFGATNHPFTTERADLGTPTLANATNKFYPYRAAGKLFFLIGSNTYMCTASLIKPGIVVTAAHCVANYGQSQFYTGWQFIPGYRFGVAPYNISTAATAYVLTKYYNGTDNCYVDGVVCPDDVAIIVLNYKPGTKIFVGKNTGYFGYGYDGYGFSGTLTHISQLGYPAGLDNAYYMERNDSYGYTDATYSNNTVVGSNMDGGSSGGPWLVNFGKDPVLTGETNGTYPANNIVVGVTSWGYTDKSYKEQGASPFTSSNIVPLVTAACGTYPAQCK
jgi:V8-like Glu-specific endopeptidase